MFAVKIFFSISHDSLSFFISTTLLLCWISKCFCTSRLFLFALIKKESGRTFYSNIFRLQQLFLVSRVFVSVLALSRNFKYIMSFRSLIDLVLWLIFLGFLLWSARYIMSFQSLVDLVQWQICLGFLLQSARNIISIFDWPRSVANISWIF